MDRWLLTVEYMLRSKSHVHMLLVHRMTKTGLQQLIPYSRKQ